MENKESDYIFLVETENENDDGEKNFDGDEDKDFNGDEDEDSGKDCDASSVYGDNDPYPLSNPNSLDPSWPKTYRDSVDLYGGVASPSLNFLGTSGLSLGGSFLSSSPKRRRSSKTITSLDSHLLPHEHCSSDHSLHHQRASSAKRLSHYEKYPQTGQSSFGQAVLNGVNLLCGVALLSTPYAVKQGGWAGLSILFIFCVLSFYTGILLRCCLDSRPGLQTYPDIGEAAFGIIGRLVVSITFYVELYASCVEFIITLIVLPTVWLRDLSVLSYISAAGVFVTILLVICLFWVGLVDSIGFHTESTTILNLSTLPVSIGLYGYCYAGHAVLPNIYMSMENKSQYPLALLASFTICTILYAGAAILGYMMFGESIESQFTLNLPTNLVASKIAVWATVISPLTKYALTISPVAKSLEELIPSNNQKSHAYSILIRTALVISTLFVALAVPFFGLVMSLIGSLLTMLVSLIFPCACFLRLLRGNVTHFQGSLCVLIIAIGIISLAFGTYTALSEIIQLL
ncbi:putative amino acid transporter, transmembrane domain-containing protein [Helianthus annuus]|nr:putative amino acid transporter, transmembrane domain-containing protein [Helianthus annuus]